MLVLLNDRNFIKAFNDTKDNCENTLCDFSDGTIYKNNSFFSSENNLEIIVFQDAFELCNPLGSSKKKHKLVGFYFIVGNLPLKYRSNINNIQLILLCKDSYIKQFGYSPILSKLIEELKLLETEGLTVNGKIFKGSVFTIVGDNLGSHQIGGFIENFSTSEYFCRYCLCTRKSLNDYECILHERRNNLNHSLHLQEKELAQTNSVKGVKEDSLFNQLENYHVCGLGLPPCIYHDLFEGIIPFDIMNILKYFHIHKIISIDQINLSMMYLRKKFKLKLSFPTIDEKMKKIPGKADEVLHFLMLLPYVFLNYIQTYDTPVWDLLSSMLEMVRIIMSSKISQNEVSQLTHFISLYFYHLKECFPSTKLKPKHHFIQHYPELIRKFGPLKHLGTIRFEQKHQYFKNISKRIKNYKNITFSLANGHQCFQSTLYEDRFQFNIVSDNTLKFNQDVYNVQIPPNFLFVSKKMQYFNTIYKDNDFVITNYFENGNILVLVINAIFIDKDYNNAIFYGKTIQMWYNYQSLLYESIKNDNDTLYSLCYLQHILINKPVNVLIHKNKHYLSPFENIA